MQAIIVAIILTSAVIFAVYHIRHYILMTSDPCSGCPGCVLKPQNREKKECQEKKS